MRVSTCNLAIFSGILETKQCKTYYIEQTRMENLSRPQQTCLVFIYYFGQFNQNVPKHILRDFMDNIRFSSLSPVKTTYYIVLLTLTSMLCYFTRQTYQTNFLPIIFLLHFRFLFSYMLFGFVPFPSQNGWQRYLHSTNLTIITCNTPLLFPLIILLKLSQYSQ